MKVIKDINDDLAYLNLLHTKLLFSRSGDSNEE